MKYNLKDNSAMRCEVGPKEKIDANVFMNCTTIDIGNLSLVFKDEKHFWHFVETIQDKARRSTFNHHKKRWKDRTCFMSSVNQMSSDHHYQELIKGGVAFGKLMLEDLRDNGPEHWFWALSEIFGANPIKEEHAGCMVEMTKDWLEWAVENGLL